jgi:hypothetical protein
MKIEIQIASVPDRKNVVAELWVGKQEIAEVSFEDGQLTIEFYSAPAPKQLRLPLDELLEALNRARRNLVP